MSIKTPEEIAARAKVISEEAYDVSIAIGSLNATVIAYGMEEFLPQGIEPKDIYRLRKITDNIRTHMREVNQSYGGDMETPTPTPTDRLDN